MSKPTRAKKRERMDEIWSLLAHKGAGPDEIDNAILADYAPISEERRAELMERKHHIEIGLGISFGKEFTEFMNRWLAEIDAELEGGSDG